jgi:adenylate cyclase
MGADELTAQLNEYFAALGRVLRDSRGYVDKFIGDGVMAFWGKPFVKEEDYATRACLSALACARAGVELRAQWKDQGKPLFFQRIGIATGDVVVGNIGTETKKNFTVIGDSVNLASRLEGANKVYGTEVLVDERTAELARRDVLFREVDQIRVVGREQPVRIFEPLAPAGTDTGPVRLSVALYERALEAYRERNFAEALVRLGDLEDGAARWLSTRCKAMAADPPPPEWQPVTEATSK